MANRRLNQFRYSFEREIVELFLKVTIGASGAPTLVANKGITSITRNSAGDYTIALNDNYNLLLGVNANFKNSTGIPAAPDVGVKTDSVNSATAPLVRVVCSTGGVATDPASGDTMTIRITCRNAST